MKVKKLKELLELEDDNAEIFAYVGAKEGWSICEIGYGDAIIGRTHQNPHDNEYFILLPVELPEEFDKWN